MIIAIGIFLFLLPSILVVFACMLSSRLSRDENWTEEYDNSETNARLNRVPVQSYNQ